MVVPVERIRTTGEANPSVEIALTAERTSAPVLCRPPPPLFRLPFPLRWMHAHCFPDFHDGCGACGGWGGDGPSLGWRCCPPLLWGPPAEWKAEAWAQKTSLSGWSCRRWWTTCCHGARLAPRKAEAILPLLDSMPLLGSNRLESIVGRTPLVGSPFSCHPRVLPCSGGDWNGRGRGSLVYLYFFFFFFAFFRSCRPSSCPPAHDTHHGVVFPFPPLRRSVWRSMVVGVAAGVARWGPPPPSKDDPAAWSPPIAMRSPPSPLRYGTPEKAAGGAGTGGGAAALQRGVVARAW